MVVQRQDLVAALSACTVTPYRAKARRFLSGLSADELQFIAEFLGSCILESGVFCRVNRERLMQVFQEARAEVRPCGSPDRDHKMILLLEYLRRSGLGPQSMAARAGGAQ